MPLNSGGEHIAFFASCNDGTGFAIAPAAAATPEVIEDALLVEVENTSGGGLTFDVATGKVTVATAAGIGKYLAEASIGDCVGQNGKFSTVQIYAKEAGVTAAATGSRAKKEEPSTAVRSALGASKAIVNLSAVGDTVEMRLGVETNADSVTIHSAHLSLLKIGEV